jgi:hypothetical protein
MIPPLAQSAMIQVTGQSAMILVMEQSAMIPPLAQSAMIQVTGQSAMILVMEQSAMILPLAQSAMTLVMAQSAMKLVPVVVFCTRVLAEEYKLRASDGWEQMEQQTEEGRSLVWHEREEQHTVPFLSLRWSELLLEQRQVLFLNMTSASFLN